jgi:hypothetical protein
MYAGCSKACPVLDAGCSGARRAKTELRGVYEYTLSDEGCSATPQTPSPRKRGMSVFQQPTLLDYCETVSRALMEGIKHCFAVG